MIYLPSCRFWVFIFHFPTGHAALSDMRSCILICWSRFSWFLLYWPQFFNFSSWLWRLSTWVFKHHLCQSHKIFCYDALLSANVLIFIFVFFAMISNCSSTFACYLFVLQKFQLLPVTVPDQLCTSAEENPVIGSYLPTRSSKLEILLEFSRLYNVLPPFHLKLLNLVSSSPPLFSRLSYSSHFSCCLK